jgi:hypothetical protein
MDRGPFVRLSGATYGEFVNDSSRDIVVLFYAETNSENIMTDELEAAANAVLASGATRIKFGLINYWKNSCEQEFPPWIGNPHVNFFPARNKTEAIPYFGPPTAAGFLRFFKANAYPPLNIQTMPMTVREAIEEKETFAARLPFLTEVAPYAEKYMRELEEVINQTK